MIILRLPIVTLVGLVWIWALSTLIFGILDAAPSNDRWTPFLLFLFTLLVGGSGSIIAHQVPQVVAAAASAGLVGFAAGWRLGGGNVALIAGVAVATAVAWAALAVSAKHLPLRMQRHSLAAIKVSAAVSLYGAAFVVAIWAIRAVLAGRLVLALVTTLTTALLLWRSHIGLIGAITSD